MPDIHIRPATAADQDTIRQMVKAEELDPTGLHWSHFLIAENGGEIVGIGQVRPYPKCRELGSLVVKEPYRRQGVGARIIHALLERETGDVYLECLDHNAAYYARFGFERVPWWRTPMPLKLKAGVMGRILRLFGYRLITMRRAKRLDGKT
ncbi:MAG: GNAT family N-acetyltransferase [Chloroflexi bacterium]|nr:GNAT family N-acetyltransferase [Chloroflexota bacterium]